jgi:hypothetical protein
VRGFGITQQGRDQFLEFIRQRIEIPADLKMQIVPHQMMKRKNIRRVGFRGCIQGFAYPIRPMKIPDTAGGVLNIRLQLEYGIAETDVTLLLGFDQSAKKRITIPSDKTWKNIFWNSAAVATLPVNGRPSRNAAYDSIWVESNFLKSEA